MACIIEELSWLQSSVSFEQAIEGDKASTQAEDIKADISSLCATLKSMVEEETAELIGEIKEDKGVDDKINSLIAPVLEAAAGMKGNPLSALAKLASGSTNTNLSKVAPALIKAGARHSKEDMERVQKIHDAAHGIRKMAVGLGADESGVAAEMSADQKEPNPNKFAAGAMAKMTAALEVETIQKEALQKSD